MWRSALIIGLFLASSCTRQAVDGRPAYDDEAHTDPVPAGDQPNWVGGTVFYDPSEGVAYGVGVYVSPTDAPERCPTANLWLEQAEAGAKKTLEGLVGELSAPPKLAYAWYDGARSIHVVVSAAVSGVSTQGLVHLKPTRGAAGPATREVSRAAISVYLARTGVCEDPHRRAALSCCGPRETFCGDASRIDRKLPDGTCRCGDVAPCLADFLCEDRQGEKECICRGDRCPCTELIDCDEGETCRDGRCY